MRSRHSVRGRLVGGFVVLTMVAASLVLATLVSMAASPEDPHVQPVPVPTPPAAQPLAVEAPATAFQRPAPVLVPTPPDSPVPSQSQASQAPALPLLGLPVLIAVGQAALRLWVGLPAERKAFGFRRTATACQECG
jgi:hypothetical protein